ncbi:hypothetical protein MFLO_13028 [Listeria floridensis FSL S10-1187]|uniref:Uncharacterized protein n=1 Tax=Listeria floridensis FSL S10-1187 TaxID=1265817 RepID=A0ABN0RCH9_9LIST|nr:hypothetical protein MFLO_13028 [Listeria floridensis FSL S10-1187]
MKQTESEKPLVLKITISVLIGLFLLNLMPILAIFG